ncbi:hypothetical protein Lesp02_21090 [Lentzea sp. NBRC 105346]|uniref:FxSxx-COOH cyclophane-containing RiPP peptide n=1 Tax=Lentzea sp. NBRC 105346 TaxID=3032205 RepID=UPI0024A18134|nr:FxSxx-COOH cyclophane-containing RiPP peptide [Lentzea sp. NBRC 105346]GLZ29919.1 hypothetical protein Lesp02_21090 [Lentzea sp. NBRC 105346]
MSAAHGPSTDLVDLTNVPLAELLTLEDSALAHALRRIRRELDNPEEAIAGFQNRI